jgi:CheY-like chemotaxis protein
MSADRDPDGPVGRPVAPILIVDDSASKRRSIAAILAPLGHEVVEATCGCRT